METNDLKYCEYRKLVNIGKWLETKTPIFRCLRLQQDNIDFETCRMCTYSKVASTPAEIKQFTPHEDRTVEYVPKDWEPPKLMEGYERDPDNPYVLRSIWPNCKYLELKFKPTKACGCLTLDAQCLKHATCAKFEQCKGCQEKEPNV